MARLERNDLGVHGDAERDGNASEAHHVQGEAQAPHRRQGDEEHERKRQEYDDRAAPMQQEDEHHERNDRDLLAEHAAQGVQDAVGQVEAVVGRDEPHPRGQTTALVVHHLRHGLDHGRYIRVRARDDDAAEDGGHGRHHGHIHAAPGARTGVVRVIGHPLRHLIGFAHGRHVADTLGFAARRAHGKWRVEEAVARRASEERRAQSREHIVESDPARAKLLGANLHHQLARRVPYGGDLGDPRNRR